MAIPHDDQHRGEPSSARNLALDQRSVPGTIPAKLDGPCAGEENRAVADVARLESDLL